MVTFIFCLILMYAIGVKVSYSSFKRTVTIFFYLLLLLRKRDFWNFEFFIIVWSTRACCARINGIVLMWHFRFFLPLFTWLYFQSRAFPNFNLSIVSCKLTMSFLHTIAWSNLVCLYCIYLKYDAQVRRHHTFPDLHRYYRNKSSLTFDLLVVHTRNDLIEQKVQLFLAAPI